MSLRHTKIPHPRLPHTHSHMHFPVLKRKRDPVYEVEAVNEVGDVGAVGAVGAVGGKTYSEVLHVQPQYIKSNDENISSEVDLNESDFMSTHSQISSLFQQNNNMRHLLSKIGQQSITVCENFRVISEIAIFQGKRIEEKDKKIAELEEELRETKKRKKRTCCMAELERKREMAELDIDYLKSEFKATHDAVSRIVANLQSVGKKIETVLED